MPGVFKWKPNKAQDWFLTQEFFFLSVLFVSFFSTAKSCIWKSPRLQGNPCFGISVSWLRDTHFLYFPIKPANQIRVFCVISGFSLSWLWFALSISLEDVSVHYAVVFNGETQLADDPDIPQEPDEEKDANAPKLKYIIVKALKQDPLLPLDIQTLSFEAGEYHLHACL